MSKILNIPNTLTFIRFITACILFAILWYASGLEPEKAKPFLLAALIIFILASTTDFLDGLIARKFGLMTVLGRIADPFVDKILVCGCLVSLIAFKESLVLPYLVVIVIAREFLVSGLRSFIESRGKEFGALFWGKAKVTTQYFFIGWDLFYIAYLCDSRAATIFTELVMIIVIGVTFISGITYVLKAIKVLKDEDTT